MCVITPPQSDEETCVRQSIMAGFDNSQYPTGYPIECPRAPAPSPGVHVDAMQNAIRYQVATLSLFFFRFSFFLKRMV